MNAIAPPPRLNDPRLREDGYLRLLARMIAEDGVAISEDVEECRLAGYLACVGRDAFPEHHERLTAVARAARERLTGRGLSLPADTGRLSVEGYWGVPHRIDAGKVRAELPVYLEVTAMADPTRQRAGQQVD